MASETGRRATALGWGAGGACTVLLAIFAVAALRAAEQKGATVDEPLHLTSAWAVGHYGDFRCDPEDPPLWKYWAVAGTRRGQMKIDLEGKPASDMLEDPRAEVALGKRTLYDPRNDADSLLRAARGRMLALAVALWGWWWHVGMAIGGKSGGGGGDGAAGSGSQFHGAGAVMKTTWRSRWRLWF